MCGFFVDTSIVILCTFWIESDRFMKYYMRILSVECWDVWGYQGLDCNIESQWVGSKK
jgi:hypothetical protein